MPADLAAERMTLSEFLAMEERSETRHEFHNGLIVEMSGGTESHSLIGVNILAFTHMAVRSRDCHVHGSNLKVHLSRADQVLYPDVFVICGKVEFLGNRKDVATNPTIVFEVLSDSTELYDRGRKFAGYQTLPSLQAYVLIAQDEPRVERFLRNGKDWTLTNFIGLEAVLDLPPLECSIPLSEIYRKVEFSSKPELHVATEA